MLKVWKTWSFAAALGLSAAAFAGDPAGLARSSGEFDLLRGEVTQTQPSGRLTSVQVGDQISAARQPVRLEAGQLGTFVVSPVSKVSVVAPGMVKLESGAMAVASSEGHVLGVRASELSVSPTPAATGEQAACVYVARLVESGAVDVQCVKGSLAVMAADGKKQVAFMTNGDALRFEKLSGEWRAGAIREGQDAVSGEEGGSAVAGEASNGKRGAAALLNVGTGGVSTASAGGVAGAGGIAATTVGGLTVTSTVTTQDTKEDTQDNTTVEESEIGSNPIPERERF